MTLAERRAELGLHIKDLARMVGVTRQSVWCWETGVSSPKARYIRAYANALKVEVEELVNMCDSTLVMSDNGRGANEGS